MAEEKKVLLKIELDIGTLKSTIQEAAANVKRLVEEQKNIEEGSNAWKINKEEIKLYTKQIADATKAVAIVNKANQDNSGSLNEMRQNLIAAKIEYANLSKEQRTNDNVGGTLQRSILSLNEEIATTEENLGVSTRRVGAYGKELLKLIGLNPTVAKGLGIADKGAQGFNTTLKANPILFIVGLLFQFKDAIVGTAEKVKFVTAIFDAFGNVLGFVKNLLLSVTDALGITSNAIENQLNKALESQAKALETVTTKLDQQIAVQNALGNDTLKLEEQKEQAVRISTEAQIKTLNKLAENQGKLNEDQQKQLDDLIKANQDAVNNIEVIQAQGIKKAADDQKKSDDDAKKANEKRIQELLKIRQQFEDVTIQLLKAGIEREVAQEKLNLQRKLDAIKGNSKIENDLREALKKESANKIQEIENKNFENEIAKGLERNKKAIEFEIQELEIKGQEVFGKKKELLDKEEELALNAAGSNAIKLAEVTKEFGLKRLALEKENSDQLILQANENHLARLEGELINLKIAGDTTIEKLIEIENEKFRIAIENSQLTADEKFKIESEHNARIAELHNQEIEEALRVEQATLEVATSIISSLGALSEIFASESSKNAEFLKALSIFEISINTATAISKAVASAKGLTGVDYALQVAIAIGAALSGIAKAKKLLSAEPPKAEKGIILGGQPHSSGGTKISADGKVVAIAEKGELLAIVNKRSTKMLSGLSNLNQAGGGIPFFAKGGVAHFPHGGVVDGGFSSRQISQGVTNRFDTLNQIKQFSKSLPSPVVIVQDINEAQGTVTKVTGRANV